MEQIEVVIPYEGKPYESGIYIDRYNCYLAKSLKTQGFVNVSVFSMGRTYIGNVFYKPEQPFNPDIIKFAFEAKQDIHVTLIPVE